MIKCVECGRFIGYADFESDQVHTDFTPDNHFGPEVIEHSHKECMKNNATIAQG